MRSRDHPYVEVVQVWLCSGAATSSLGLVREACIMDPRPILDQTTARYLNDNTRSHTAENCDVHCRHCVGHDTGRC